MSLIVSYHPDITLQNMYLNQILGNFIETVGQNIVSCFPFLNWFIIPAAGMLFGNDLKRCNDKDKLYTDFAIHFHNCSHLTDFGFHNKGRDVCHYRRNCS